MDETKKPHWAWPHAIGVIVAIAAYFVIFRFTGESDFFLPLAMGVGGMAVTWGYLRLLVASRARKS